MDQKYQRFNALSTEPLGSHFCLLTWCAIVLEIAGIYLRIALGSLGEVPLGGSFDTVPYSWPCSSEPTALIHAKQPHTRMEWSQHEIGLLVAHSRQSFS